ncbi:unnamed protein product [Trifolium pratense]|uniref:Uncharacterized protein n=1 Tax=Trifolium pratense TaxID=57577 RepID=A0ACB0IZ35_TRIPR|nr:unnamed protein product [Trifolium pratense]
MSRLDRFPFSEEWCLAWPNCKQVARLRGLSDHCPLVLSANEEDWGPQPSRMLKCWKDIPGYNMLSALDEKGEEEDLFEEELAEFHGVSLDIHSLSRLHASISWQQSRALWLKEGDANSKYFHLVLASRRRRNTMSVIQVDGVTLEGVTPIRLTKGINSTFIALIPKTGSPQRLNDFQPISLVGSLYKILAKDGILIANEVVNEARKSKRDLMLFKVDFEKAYDSVDSGYLDDVMGRMSFPTLWRKWIIECVCTATTSVLVNGSPTDEFPLRRGLIQGDPLSPFLFLLAAEGLNVLMEAMVARNLFTRYSIGGQGSIAMSHLQFADDTLLMRVKSWANVRALRAVLVLFETMSVLKVNFNKSMLVGINVPDSWLGEAASALCCKVGKIPFLYLGLQIGGDPRRLVFWESVLTHIKNRLSG